MECNRDLEPMVGLVKLDFAKFDRAESNQPADQVNGACLHFIGVDQFPSCARIRRSSGSYSLQRGFAFDGDAVFFQYWQPETKRDAFADVGRSFFDRRNRRHHLLFKWKICSTFNNGDSCRGNNACIYLCTKSIICSWCKEILFDQLILLYALKTITHCNYLRAIQLLLDEIIGGNNIA